MVQSGLITQAEAQLRIDRAKRQIGRVQFFRDLEDDPHSVSEVLEFGAVPEGFSPADLDKAKKYAKQQMKRVEAEEAREDADWIAENRHMGMDEVKERLDGRHYGAGVRESLMKDWRDDPNRKIDFAKVSEVKQRNRTLTHASSEEAKHQGYLDALEAAPRGWVREHLLESFGGSIGDHTGQIEKAKIQKGIKYGEAILNAAFERWEERPPKGMTPEEVAEVKLILESELAHYVNTFPDARQAEIIEWAKAAGVELREGDVKKSMAPDGLWMPPPRDAAVRKLPVPQDDGNWIQRLFRRGQK